MRKRLTHKQIIAKCALRAHTANTKYDGGYPPGRYACVDAAHLRATQVAIRTYCREMIRAGYKFRVP